MGNSQLKIEKENDVSKYPMEFEKLNLSPENKDLTVYNIQWKDACLLSKNVINAMYDSNQAYIGVDIHGTYRLINVKLLNKSPFDISFNVILFYYFASSNFLQNTINKEKEKIKQNFKNKIYPTHTSEQLLTTLTLNFVYLNKFKEYFVTYDKYISEGYAFISDTKLYYYYLDKDEIQDHFDFCGSPQGTYAIMKDMEK